MTLITELKNEIGLKNNSSLRKRYHPFFINIPISVDSDRTYKALELFQSFQKNKLPRFKDLIILIKNFK